MKNSIRIIVSENNPMTRAGLIALIRSFRTKSEHLAKFEVVGEASNGEEVIRLAEELYPDVIIIDARMPLGIEATKIMKTKFQHVKVIVMSMYPDKRLPAYSVGADLFLEKGNAEANLYEVILELVAD